LETETILVGRSHFLRTGKCRHRRDRGNVAVSATDLAQLLRFAKENDVDLTVVGPDDPLAMGIVDLFTADKLRIFGPTKSAARLESSKIFAKELMRSQKIPTAQARTFSDSKERLAIATRLDFRS